jgi:hypothetical protein
VEEVAVVEAVAEEGEMSPGLRARRKRRRRGGIRRRIRERGRITIGEMRELRRWPVEDLLDKIGEIGSDIYSSLSLSVAI